MRATVAEETWEDLEEVVLQVEVEEGVEQRPRESRDAKGATGILSLRGKSPSTPGESPDCSGEREREL